jgi:hypothetical protein
MKKMIFLTTLCLSLATGTVFSQSYGGGRGTESDPFLISSRTHLRTDLHDAGATDKTAYHPKIAAGTCPYIV